MALASYIPRYLGYLRGCKDGRNVRCSLLDCRSCWKAQATYDRRLYWSTSLVLVSLQTLNLAAKRKLNDAFLASPPLWPLQNLAKELWGRTPGDLQLHACTSLPLPLVYVVITCFCIFCRLRFSTGLVERYLLDYMRRDLPT